MKVSNLDKIILILLYCLLSIQNGFFDEIFNLFNMDLFSILLSFMLIGYFFILLYRKVIKIDSIFIIFIILILYKLIVAVIVKNPISNILIDFRTTVYFFTTYLIYKYSNVDEEYFIKIIKTGGLLNSLIFLYFMNKIISEFGIGARDVSINLYISFFSMAIILFIDKKGLYSFKNDIIIILNFMAIVLSQQRTVIIPLIVLIVLFLLKNFRFNFKKITTIIIISLLCLILLNYLKNIGILELIKNRFSVELFSGENSTLNIRNETMKLAFSQNNIVNFILGCPFGFKYSDLELLIPNYIIKYGVIGVVIIFFYYVTIIINSYKKYYIYQKKILWIYIIMLIGGIISGFGGATGQMLNAFILAILTKPKNLILKGKESYENSIK
ncbi:hypothetical protein ACV3XZ_06830 [Clostridium perfringens]